MAVNVQLIYGHLAGHKPTTATNEVSGFPASAATDLDRTTYWQGASGATINLTVDTEDTTSTKSGIGIANHNFATLIAEGATITFKRSTDNFSGSDVSVKTMVPLTNNDYWATFTGQTTRYWRLAFTSLGATKPKVGEFYIGTALTLPVNPDVGMDGADVPQVFLSRALSGRKVTKKAGRITRREEMRFGVLTLAQFEQMRTVHTSVEGNYRPLVYVPRYDSTTPTEGEAYLARMERFEWSEIFGGIFRLDVVLEEEQ